MTQSSTMTTHRSNAYLLVLIVLGLSHLLNDLMQSLIMAVYPIIKETHGLTFVQIGMITLIFQLAGSLLQPVVGYATDRRPAPYSPVIGMGFTFTGLLLLSRADSYGNILVSVVLIGIGSSIFHPEATRMARYASGGQQGLAQGIFQVGGQAGGALGPVLAALLVVPWGQGALAWFAVLALIAMALLGWIGRQQGEISRAFANLSSKAAASAPEAALGRGAILQAMVILTLLVFSKNAYGESFRSFYTFYLIETFGLSIPASQMMLFLFMIAAVVGVLVGGIIGDRIGRHRIIWLSILGPLPLTLLLPWVDLFWTGVLTVLINLIMASAFPAILIYAMDLLPRRVGLIGGLFYGLNFGLGGLAAGVLGAMVDQWGIATVYQICAFLPLAGLLTWFLPRQAQL